jgi:iron complex transport system substrate-binding protein
MMKYLRRQYAIGRARLAWCFTLCLFAFGCMAAMLVTGCDENEALFNAAENAAVAGADREGREGRETGSDRYSVTLAPAGNLLLRTPPERFVAHRATEAEIALALGRGDGLVAMFGRPFLVDTQRLFYRQIPDFEPDLSNVRPLPLADRVDDELFYELDADLHMVDPRYPVGQWGWAVDDLRTLVQKTGPFVGNFIRLKDRPGPP